MTSNLGSAVFQDEGLSPEKRKEEILADVRGFFRPEFVNRIDEIVVFEPLTRSHIREIVAIQLRELRERLAERSIELRLSEAATDLLAAAGYDPAFGARPLKRLIQRELQDALAMRLLSGQLRDGDAVIVDAEGGELAIETAPRPADE
jgi:ATP-dependent Clp protease ATP-binding subunit ClpB